MEIKKDEFCGQCHTTCKRQTDLEPRFRPDVYEAIQLNFPSFSNCENANEYLKVRSMDELVYKIALT